MPRQANHLVPWKSEGESGSHRIRADVRRCAHPAYPARSRHIPRFQTDIRICLTPLVAMLQDHSGATRFPGTLLRFNPNQVKARDPRLSVSGRGTFTADHATADSAEGGSLSGHRKSSKKEPIEMANKKQQQ